MITTSESGKEAEELVAKYLKKQKHRVVSMNWRTRWCEIDIVSKTKGCVYFTEVKYRSSDAWGDGFSYISPKKVKQMQFAAEMWLNDNDWQGECVLQGAAVDASGDIEIVEI